MKKSKFFTSVGLSVGLLCLSNQALAAEKDFAEFDQSELEKFADNEMPQEVKDVLLNVPLQKDSPMQVQDIPEIIPYATHAIPGNTTQDSTFSKTFGEKGVNTIYTEVDSQGFWSSLAFNQFSGYGYTGYRGSETPAAGSITSSTSVKAYGIIPSISVGGSSWSLLATAKSLSDDENKKGNKYAKATYSNVKIQRVTGVNTIFYNKAHIKVPSGLNDTWEEDTYVWF